MPTINRRALVAGIAAAAPAVVLASTPLLAAPDPIFAAIERHKLTEVAFLGRCDWKDAQKQAGVELTPASAHDYRTAEMAAIVKASISARQDLWLTAPTTPAGLVACLDYLVVAAEGRNAIECADEK